MTRARYFLFVPWMYLELERKGFRDNVESRARRAEVQLIDTLGEEPGTIGKLAKGTLKRLPSSIYWLGPRTGASGPSPAPTPSTTALSRAARTAPTARPRRRWRARRRWKRAELARGTAARPHGLSEEASLDLTRAEATYLRERIRFRAPGSMLALLLRSGALPDVAYPWMHPRLADFPQDVRDSLSHAQCFAEMLQGAAVLYNLMLAEADQRDSVEDFRARLTEWSEELRGRERELRNWRFSDFWQLARSIAKVEPRTFEFVNHWIELNTWETPAKACDDKTARALLRMREQRLKGPRARLDNPRALELWGGDSGTGRLAYRWPTGRRLRRHSGGSGKQADRRPPKRQPMLILAIAAPCSKLFVRRRDTPSIPRLRRPTLSTSSPFSRRHSRSRSTIVSSHARAMGRADGSTASRSSTRSGSMPNASLSLPDGWHRSAEELSAATSVSGGGGRSSDGALRKRGLPPQDLGAAAHERDGSRAVQGPLP